MNAYIHHKNVHSNVTHYDQEQKQPQSPSLPAWINKPCSIHPKKQWTVMRLWTTAIYNITDES